MAAASLVLWLVAWRGGGAERRALIVDQLSDTVPNVTFTADATWKLANAQYAVDYVGGRDVTVDFYRHLPRRKYDLVIVRGHSGRMQVDDQSLSAEVPEFTEDAALFTSEPWDRLRYREEQMNRSLSISRYDVRQDPSYFGITPKFIRDSMQGNLAGATIVLMGCDGLRGVALASAFRARGASVVIGWNEPVTAQRTDDAALRLIDHLVIDRMSAQVAVSTTMEEVGVDPTHHSELVIYGAEPLPAVPAPLPLNGAVAGLAPPVPFGN